MVTVHGFGAEVMVSVPNASGASCGAARGSSRRRAGAGVLRVTTNNALKSTPVARQAVAAMVNVRIERAAAGMGGA